MLDFLYDYIPYICLFLSGLISVLNLAYTRKTGKSISKEVSNVIETVTPQQRLSEREESRDGQVFNPLVKQYRYNKATNELEELPDMLDISKLVQSHMDSCLAAMKEKFLNTEETVAQYDVQQLEEDLAQLGDSLDTFEEMREKYGMSDDSSYDDILKRIEEDISAQVKAQSAAQKLAQENSEKELREKRIAELQALLGQDKGEDNNASS